MFKFLVLSVLLCQEIYEISGQTQGELTDTPVPLVPSNPVNDCNKEIPELKSQHVTHQIFNFNGPLAWKWPTSLSNVDKKVRPDYTLTIGIGAHKVHHRRLPWNKARQICLDEGGHLAVIRTIEEVQAVKSLMVKESVGDAWVGFHDSFQEGDWVTVLDEPLAEMEWSPWFADNPNNAGGKENCAVFLTTHENINDDTCEKLYPFICKITI